MKFLNLSKERLKVAVPVKRIARHVLAAARKIQEAAVQRANAQQRIVQIELTILM